MIESITKTDNFLISVIIPTYNRAYCVGRAVASLQRQTYQNLEIIIIDDASSDNIVQVAEELKANDSRIRFYQVKKNVGVSAIRNLGIQYAKGEYINFLDSDDELYENGLSTMLHTIKTNSCDFVIGKFSTGDSPAYRKAKISNLELIELVCSNKHFCLAGILWPSAFLRNNNIIFKPWLRAGSDKVILVEALRKSASVKMIDELVLKVNNDSTNSITQQHKKLWHKIVYMRGRWAILVQVLPLFKWVPFMLAFKQLIVSFKRLVYHFLEANNLVSSRD